MMDSNPQGRYLGMVVGGSLSRGVEVRLDSQAPVEEMALGQHVVIQGQRRRFFGVITDITLESSDDSIRANPPDLSNPLVARVVSSTAVYATLRVLLMLALDSQEKGIVAFIASNGIASLRSIEYIERSASLWCTGAKPNPQLPFVTEVTPCQLPIVQWGSQWSGAS